MRTLAEAAVKAPNLVFLLVLVALWIVLQAVVLPRAGVPT